MCYFPLYSVYPWFLDPAGCPSWLIGGVFPNTPWPKQGIFLGIAPVSFRGQTPLLLGHHTTPTDGTGITSWHATGGWLGVRLLFLWLGLDCFLCHNKRKMTAAKEEALRLTRKSNVVAFQMKSSWWGSFRDLGIKRDHSQIDHHLLVKRGLVLSNLNGHQHAASVTCTKKNNPIIIVYLWLQCSLRPLFLIHLLSFLLALALHNTNK